MTDTPIPAAPSDVAGLVERLRRKASMRSFCDTLEPVNPDGPEAAALIESLAHDREVMRVALGKIAAKDALNYDVGTYATEHQEGYGDGYDMAAGECAEEARAALASLKGGA